MPRGKFTNHKGKHRSFTNPYELEEERKRDERERAWRKTRGDESSEEEDDAAARPPPKSSDESESDSEEEESDEDAKGKGVEKLIEIANPNRIQSKSKKLSTLNETLTTAAAPELSRREREELEKQQAAAKYRKLHAEGRTREAQADLARLAIIKQQREEAAKKRESDKQQKEAEAKAKSAQRDKALGKK